MPVLTPSSLPGPEESGQGGSHYLKLLEEGGTALWPRRGLKALATCQTAGAPEVQNWTSDLVERDGCFPGPAAGQASHIL